MNTKTGDFKMRKILRKLLFNYCFTEDEKVSIINGLFRRNKDFKTSYIEKDKLIRDTRQKLAMEFSNY